MKCGIEIHQQLAGKKLFCNCNSIIIDGKPDFTFERKLRTSQSEMGETDKAALFEAGKKRTFVYNGYHDSNCLTCIDEEPPQEINKEALDIAMQVALLLNAKPVDEVQVMRKVVIDGSNVSGFQRTALIATDGYLETSEGKIEIESICLEEEAAKKLGEKVFLLQNKNKKKYNVFQIKYNISRLGIPLIEIATGPQIKSPEGAKEAASKIGMILRSVKGMKRGIGSIRQDVNVSFNSPRVEIKGFQDLQSIPKVIEFEKKRQKKEGIKDAHVRKANKNLTTSYLRPMPGAGRMYPETDVPTVQITPKYLKSLELPVLIDHQIEDLIEVHKLQPALAREIVKKDIIFEHYSNEYPKLDTNLIARTLIETPKELKSRLKLDTSKLTSKHFHEVFNLLNKKKINKNNITGTLTQLIKKGKVNLSSFETASDKDLENAIKQIIKKNPGISFGGIMGDLMKKFKGKADGKKASQIIKKLL